MARKSKAQRFLDVHHEAMKRFQKVQASCADERDQCLADRRFCNVAGGQWEGALAEQFENRPRLEVNKIQLAVTRIINEYRNNRITVDFVPKDGATDSDLADTCDGLYRADEQDSCADEAYDNAFEEAVTGGFGAFRLRTEYEDEGDPEDERQRVRIEPIYDADRFVFFDPDAKRQDKSDARFCFVLTAMSPDAYEEDYGEEASPSSMTSDIDMTEFDWHTSDVVYVSEYYVVEQVSENVYVYRLMDGTEERYTDSDFEQDEMLERRLNAINAVQVRTKTVKRKKIRKYILDGGRILEDLGHIAGDCIPIVPVYGKRFFIDNRERMHGHVRMVKDSQRLKNMQLSRLAEISAYSTIEKPIMSPEQVAGNVAEFWRQDNVKNYPFMLINPVTNADGQEVLQGPVDYTRAPNIPPAMAALLQITETDMQEIMGRMEAGDELNSNLSGKAIELVQNRLDHQNYIYMSNMAKAIKRSGEIWLGMCRDILIEERRTMKSVSLSGEMETVELFQPTLDEKTGARVIRNDMSRAKFDVAVDVGPTSSSKRSATVRALTGMMGLTAEPETQVILTSLTLMNMEGEGLKETRQYFRKKLVGMGVVEPNEAEIKEMEQAAQNQQPDANAQYLQAAAAEAQAKALKAQADTAHTVAKTAETEAKTFEILAGIDETERGQALAMQEFQARQALEAERQQLARQREAMNREPVTRMQSPREGQPASPNALS